MTRDKFAHLPRSIPSLMNLEHQRWFFWDGRSDRLWQQALGPLEDTREMNSHRLYLIAALASDRQLQSLAIRAGVLDSASAMKLRRHLRTVIPSCTGTNACQDAWRDVPLATQNEINRVTRKALEALEAFQLTLSSPATRYDEYLSTGIGLTGSEERGMKLFFGAARCSNCHSGPAMTDGGFHNLLLPAAPKRPREDPGRYAGIDHLRQLVKAGDLGYRSTELAAHLDQDNTTWGQFKTPSIRNISGRTEFMHSGVFRTIRDVLNYYNTLSGALIVHHHPNALLSPLNLREEQLDDLEHFLQIFNRRTQ